MLQLWTFCPYGLNERLGCEFKTPEREVLIGRKSPSLPRIYNRVCSGSQDTKAVVHPNELISKFKNLIHNGVPNVLNFARISIMGVKKLV